MNTIIFGKSTRLLLLPLALVFLAFGITSNAVEDSGSDTPSSSTSSQLSEAANLFQKARDKSDETTELDDKGLVDNDDLLEALTDSASAEIPLASFNNAYANEAVEHLKLIGNRPELLKEDLAVDSRILAGSLLFQNADDFKKMLEGLVDELRADGDYPEVSFYFNSSPFPQVTSRVGNAFTDLIEKIKYHEAYLDRVHQQQKESGRGDWRVKKQHNHNTSSDEMVEYRGIENFDYKKFLEEGGYGAKKRGFHGFDGELDRLYDEFRVIYNSNERSSELKTSLKISISAGAIAFLETKDEFAALIAQALSRLNPKVYALADDPRVKSALSKTVGFSSLHKDEQLTIKADIGAIERLITKGYNPWALSRYERRVYELLIDRKLRKKKSFLANRIFIGRSLKRVKVDKTRSIRHKAIEMFIGALTESEVINKEDTPLPSNLKALKKVLSAFVKPYFSPFRLLGLPAVAGTAYLGVQPLVAVLAALGVETAITTTVITTVGSLVAGGVTLIAGGAGAAAGAALLYLGYKHRGEIYQITKNQIQRAPVAGKRILLGTSSIARKTGIAIGNQTVRSLVWTGKSFAWTTRSVANGFVSSFVRPSKMLIRFAGSSMDRAGKNVLFLTDATKATSNKLQARSRAVKLFKDFVASGQNDVGKLSAVLDRIHTDINAMDQSRVRNREFKEKLKKKKVIGTIANALYQRPDIYIRGVYDYAFYYDVLKRLINLVESKGLSIQEIKELFQNSKLDELPLDLKEARNYQILLNKLIVAAQANSSTLEFDQFLKEKLSSTPQDVLGLASLIYSLKQAIQTNDMVSIAKLTPYLSDLSLETTREKVFQQTWIDTLRALADSTRKIDAKTKELLIAQLHSMLSTSRDSIRLKRKFYNSLSNDDLIALFSQTQELRILQNSTYFRARKALVKKLIEIHGSSEGARNHIQKIARSHGGDTSTFVDDLYDKGTRLPFGTAEELIQYLNYLSAKDYSYRKIITEEEINHLITEVIRLYNSSALTKEHLKAVADSRIVLSVPRKYLESTKLQASMTEFYQTYIDAKIESTTNALVPANRTSDGIPLNSQSILDVSKLFFELHNFSRNPIQSARSPEFYGALLEMSRQPTRYHYILSDWLKSNIDQLLTAITDPGVEFELKSHYIRFLSAMTRIKKGQGHSREKKKDGHYESKWFGGKVLPRKSLRAAVERAKLKTKAIIINQLVQTDKESVVMTIHQAYLLSLPEDVRKSQVANQSNRNYLANSESFFKVSSSWSDKLQAIARQYAKEIVDQHPSFSEALDVISRHLGDESIANYIHVEVLRALTQTDLKIEDEETLDLIKLHFFEPNEFLADKPEILDIDRDTAFAFLAKLTLSLFDSKFVEDPMSTLKSKGLWTSHTMRNALAPFFNSFPSPYLEALYQRLHVIPGFKSFDFIKDSPIILKMQKDGHTESSVISKDSTLDLYYLAELTNQITESRKSYNPKQIIGIFKQMTELAKTSHYGTTKEGQHFPERTIKELFTKYGSKLFKYLISHESNSKERFIAMQALKRIAVNDNPIKAGSEAPSVAAFLGFGKNYHFMSIKRILAISMRHLNSDEQEVLKTLFLAHEFKIRKKNEKLLKMKLYKGWIKRAANMQQLDQFIQTEIIDKGANIQAFAGEMFSLIEKRPDLILSLEDAHAFLRNNGFWPESNLEKYEASPLEKPFVEIIERKRKDPNANQGSWIYAPSFSEQAHAFVYNQLVKKDLLPQTFDELFKLWVSLTNRGVSSVSDRLLEQIIEIATDEQKEQMKAFAIKEQRIFETTVRDQLVIEQIEDMKEYQHLVGQHYVNEQQRLYYLETVVEKLQELMPERGLRYQEFLENLSVDIMSSQTESQYIHSQKNLGEANEEDSTDENIDALHNIVESIVDWPEEEQLNFIYFLRGDTEASDYIRDQFPLVGAERIRRMYEILPVEYRLGILDFYLGQTIFVDPENLDISKGNARKLIEHAITGGKKETDPKKLQAQEVTRQILLAGLEGIKSGSKDAEFQKLIVANILAFPQDGDGNIGRTLKLVLEKGFGPLGVKMGQLIVAMNILDPEDAKELRDVQDNARPLEREDQYEEFRKIFDTRNLPFTMNDLLGSASIKWAVKGHISELGQDVAVKVFRSEVKTFLHNRYKVLETMIEYLVKNVGPEYRIMSAIVDSAKRAVEKELDGEAEVERSKVAKERLYINLSDNESNVIVPDEQFESGRIIISQYLEGQSFHRLPESIKHIAAEKILSMEMGLLWSDEDEITFDPDRHGGNYRIYLPKYDGDKYIVFEPIQYGVIDFGQVLTISKQQRQDIIDIFALSQIISTSGTMKILTEKLGSIFGLEGDKLTELGKVLRTYFPNPKLKEQTAYFATLSALHEVGVELDPGYFDFTRAVLQLMQYEPYMREGFVSPSKELENRIIERVADYLRELAEEQKGTAAILNTAGRLKSMLTNTKHLSISTDISTEDVMAFRFDGSVYEDPKLSSRSSVVPAVFGFTCEAQFR